MLFFSIFAYIYCIEDIFSEIREQDIFDPFSRRRLSNYNLRRRLNKKSSRAQLVQYDISSGFGTPVASLAHNYIPLPLNSLLYRTTERIFTTNLPAELRPVIYQSEHHPKSPKTTLIHTFPFTELHPHTSSISMYSHQAKTHIFHQGLPPPPATAPFLFGTPGDGGVALNSTATAS